MKPKWHVLTTEWQNEYLISFSGLPRVDHIRTWKHNQWGFIKTVSQLHFIGQAFDLGDYKLLESTFTSNSIENQWNVKLSSNFNWTFNNSVEDSRAFIFNIRRANDANLILNVCPHKTSACKQKNETHVQDKDRPCRPRSGARPVQRGGSGIWHSDPLDGSSARTPICSLDGGTLGSSGRRSRSPCFPAFPAFSVNRTSRDEWIIAFIGPLQNQKGVKYLTTRNVAFVVSAFHG